LEPGSNRSRADNTSYKDEHLKKNAAMMLATLVIQRVRNCFSSLGTLRGLFFWSPVLLASIACICVVISLWIFYCTLIHQYEIQLTEEIAEQVKSLEAIGRSNNWDEQKTLKQYDEFIANHHKLGETGEFVIATSAGNNIRFLFKAHSIDPKTISGKAATTLAEPMRKALQGHSGTIIGIDYRGKEVLAAYAFIPRLKWGIDAKIDISEIRAPFLKSTSILIVMVLILVVGGSFLIVRLGRPLIQDLEAEIAERKQIERELCTAKDTAEAANRAKSEFLANMSHEIRTPMTAILGFADILLENSANEEAFKAARIIKSNGQHLLDIINIILDLSRIEAGKQDVEITACSPRRIATDVVSSMKVRADAKGLQLTLEFQGPIPKNIKTDSIHLRQILLNLIGNAIKFTELGSVRIVMHLDQCPNEEPKLRFDITDTGIGIQKELQQVLFQPFSQVDSSVRRLFGGTGLGLAISKRLAGILGGDIEVSSLLGKGSTFSLTIATGPLDADALDSNSVTTNEPVLAPSAHHRKLNCSILLAEDGIDNRRLITHILRKAGAKVTQSANGRLAFDLASKAGKDAVPFDIILMDMQMPVMDGYEATRQLREIGWKRPIIALTAHAMTDDRQKCLDAGCDDYLTKPIDRNQLLEMIEKYINAEPGFQEVNVERQSGGG
jgi:signal transduction histidine kinase/ActR/RegA family two-component response regulator